MARFRLTTFIIVSFAITASLLASACGGGGGGGGGAQQPPPGGSSPPPPPPSGGAPTWTPNVFQAASTFADRCQTVRTGRDSEGNPFPDQQGTLLQETHWLRAWTHETYLWNTEVTDRDPGTFTERTAYFDVLRTTARTPSSKDKDQFHFHQPTADYLAQRNSEPSATYGASYAALATAPPRDFRIQYTEPNSPAAQILQTGRATLPRGAKILRVDGADLINGNDINTLNAGLFPARAGETHTLIIQEPGGTAQRSVTITSVNLAPKPVNRSRIIATPNGSMGYLLITTFSPFAAEQDIAQAMTAMRNANVGDLILDLRYNGGGLLAIASQLGYMIAGSRTSGRTFERLEFNALAGTRNPITGEANQPEPFHSTGVGFTLANGTRLDTLNLQRVYILSTDETCSASESVINSLRGVDVEVVLIGGTTCGKPYGFYPTDNCGETYYTIQFRGVNDKGFGDYADGFTPQNSNASFGVRAPGCFVSDDYEHELGDETEGLLAAALQYRQNGTCPAFVRPQAAPMVQAQAGPGLLRTTPLTPLQEFLRSNRDMRMPH